MAIPRVSPRLYRRITLGAMVSLYVIVVTGALVRLTGSGLGCSDWPNCNQERFVDVSTGHAAIEQLNRLFTGVVAAAVILAVLASLRRAPRRRDLTWLSVGLVAGVVGQAVLGGIVVLTHLNPVAVQGHFVLSMVLMANALVLYRRAGWPDDAVPRRVVPVRVRRIAWAVTVASAAAVVTGTVVTGTGPHSGSHDGEPVERFPFAITSVTRVHTATVFLALALAVWLAYRSKAKVLERSLSWFVGLGLLQGVVGYVQYFSGVPVALVAVHVTFATAVWMASVAVGLATVSVATSPPEAATAGAPAPRSTVPQPTW
jgi:cytochrome c oxidase assembly protein subunit 15